MTEWRRRNPKRSTTEMGQENQRSCSRALQRQASFIANRGWKSSNSSPLSVGGELFPLTSPFIELRWDKKINEAAPEHCSAKRLSLQIGAGSLVTLLHFQSEENYFP